MTKTKRSKKEYPKQDIARVALGSSCNAAAVISYYGRIYGEQNIDALIDEMMKLNSNVAGGDLSKLENMLVDQSLVLQSIFANLSVRAYDSDRMDHLERYLRLALKAQAQCARTIEALSAFKNPTQVTVMNQANIKQALQVNSAPGLLTQAYVSESVKSTNELLEVTHGQRLDTRETEAAIATYTPLEPLK